MKERPILFSGAMVRAILDGRKTMTRRVMKPQIGSIKLIDTAIGIASYVGLAMPRKDGGYILYPNGRDKVLELCPYGVPGDRLWVRETWSAEDALDDLAPRSIPPGGPIWYAADNSLRGLRGILHMGKNRPGMFMPRWASRLTLEVVSVRVERLQEISEADALAEGLREYDNGTFGLDDHACCMGVRASVAYMRLWDSINAKRAPWESNPWVWVIEFRRAP